MKVTTHVPEMLDGMSHVSAFQLLTPKVKYYYS